MGMPDSSKARRYASVLGGGPDDGAGALGWSPNPTNTALGGKVAGAPADLNGTPGSKAVLDQIQKDMAKLLPPAPEDFADVANRMTRFAATSFGRRTRASSFSPTTPSLGL